MDRIACKRRSLGAWLALGTVCGMALTSSAHAQGWWNNGAASQQKKGCVLVCPIGDVAWLVNYNLVRQKNVSVLNIFQFGGINMAAVAVTQRNAFNANGNGAGAANVVYCPPQVALRLKQFNKSVVNVAQAGGQNVAAVVVDQSNVVNVPAKANWFVTPTSTVPFIVQKNKSVVNVAQIGNGNLAAVAVDQQNAANVAVPASAVTVIAQINISNVTVVQVGEGNQAIIGVTQQNQIGGATGG